MIDWSSLRVSEQLAAIYFAYLVVAAIARPLPLARRLRVAAASAALAVAYAMLLTAPQTIAVTRIRDWLPAPVILLAYFTTGAFFVAPSHRAEAWLRRWDTRWLGGRSLGQLPRVLVTYLDWMYAACFLVIPAGFALLAWTGRSALADRYWTLVSAAEFGAFASLPWFQARPPWAIESPRPIDETTMRRFSLFWVKHATIGATTFPSGHVAGSLAVAFALMGPLPAPGVVFFIVAVIISVGCIVGRYHYIADVVAGVLLAVGICMMTVWYLPGFHA